MWTDDTKNLDLYTDCGEANPQKIFITYQQYSYNFYT